MLRHSIAALAAALLLAACGSAPGPSSGAAPTSPSAAVTPQPGAPPTSTPIPQPVAGTSAHRPALDEPFSLQGSMTAFVDAPDQTGDTSALKITFESLLNDSRCPTSVNCVEAGDATIAIVAQHGDRAPENLQLHTTRPGQHIAVAYATFAIQLVGLEPHPKQPGDSYALSEYTAQLIVSRTLPTNLTPSPSTPGSARNRLNACSLADQDQVVKLFGAIHGGPTPNATATHNGQACDISAERATLTIRFYRGDVDTAHAVAAELQQMGEPLPDLAEDTLGLAAFGQNERKAIMLRQTNDYIIIFGIVFGSQSQPGDHERARLNLDTLQNIAFVRYTAGQTEDLVMPTQTRPTTPPR